MKIRDLIWLESVEDKIIRKHSVYPVEVEEVFYNTPHLRFMEKGHQMDEDLYAAFGRTDSGRYLAVYFIAKKGQTALIVTARQMTNKEKKRYG